MNDTEDNNIWRDRNKIFIAGIPNYIQENQLNEKFTVFGHIFQAKIVFDKKTGKSKGFGFVTFDNYESALDAVNEMNQKKWDDRILNVRFLALKNKNNNDTNGFVNVNDVGPCPKGCTTIYAGNLPYEITEEILRKLFSSCGDIKAIRFAEDIKTKEFRGFGYIQFYDEESCEKAINNLSGSIVMGRKIKLDYGARDTNEVIELNEQQLKRLKKGICHKFKEGLCERGDNCKFAHMIEKKVIEVDIHSNQKVVTNINDVNDSDINNNSDNMIQINDAPFDAPICLNFQKDKCKRGQSCRFRHLKMTETTVSKSKDSYEVQANNQNVEKAQEVEIVTKQINETLPDAPICMNYQKGKCKRGNNCRFKHLEEITKAEKTLSSMEKKISNTTEFNIRQVNNVPGDAPVCISYKTNKCKRGESCKYRHLENVETIENKKRIKII